MKSEAEPDQVQYFPEGIFDDKPELDCFASDQYSSTLKFHQEPSLWKLSQSEKPHIYRFMWIPSLETMFACGLAKVVVRLTIEANGKASLTAEVAGETSTKERSVTAEETAAFMYVVDSTEFWELPTRSKSRGLDGATWITEGTRNGRYHVVVRWCPKDVAYRELGLHFLLKLAELPYEKIP